MEMRISTAHQYQSFYIVCRCRQMEELKVKGIDELCEWLEGQPEMKGKYDILEPACKVIREQKIYGDSFITYTRDEWKDDGLPGGAAKTLVQIAERVKEEKYTGKRIL